MFFGWVGALILFALFALGTALVEGAAQPAPKTISTDGPWRLIRVSEPGFTPRRGLEVWVSEAGLAASQQSGEQLRRIVTLVHKSDSRAAGERDGFLTFSEFDCERGRWREIASQEIADGEPLPLEIQAAEWDHFIPHTSPVFVSDHVCESSSFEKLHRVATSREAFAFEQERDRLFEIARESHMDRYSVWARIGSIGHEAGNDGEVAVWFQEKLFDDEEPTSDSATLVWPVTTLPHDRSAAYHRLRLRCGPTGPTPQQYTSHAQDSGLVEELALEDARAMLANSSRLAALAAMACSREVPEGAERSTGLESFWTSPSASVRSD